MNAQAGTQPERLTPGGRADRFSKLTTVIAWLLLVPMIVPSDLTYSATEYAGEAANPAARALLLSILGISAIIVLVRIATVLRVMRELNIFHFAFLGLATASLAWSIDPGLTTVRIVRLLILSAAILAIAVAGWHPRRFQELVRPVLTLLLLGSLVFGLLRPELAIQREVGFADAWRGLATQKNGLGALASFGFILWFHAWLAKEVKPLSALIGGAAAASCLILSRSSTALMATVFVSLSLLLLLKVPASARRYVPYLVTALTIAILTYSIAMLKLVPGLEILLAPIPMITGKDLTFTGRTDIWAAVIDHIRIRPLLGSGYGAFWAGPVPSSESYYMVKRLEGFYPGSAHNGYLDVLNDLGIAGLLCLGGYLIVYVRQSLRLFSFDRVQGGLFLGLFLQQTLTNLSEAHWFNIMGFDFVLMSIAIASLARALLDRRVRPMPRTVMARPSNPRVVPNAAVRKPFGARRLR